jgi:hypothetical protein
MVCFAPVNIVNPGYSDRLMKIAVFGLLTIVAMLLSSPAFAGKKSGDHGCCASNTSNAGGPACIDYASLSLSADQKSKIQAWQTECTKAGCTKESRHTFLKQAKGILSPGQYAKLKEQCEKPKAKA